MTLKELIQQLNEFDLDKYGDCLVCRPTGHWDGCPIDLVEVTDMIDDNGIKNDCIFIDLNYPS